MHGEIVGSVGCTLFFYRKNAVKFISVTAESGMLIVTN